MAQKCGFQGQDARDADAGNGREPSFWGLLGLIGLMDRGRDPPPKFQKPEGKKRLEEECAYRRVGV